MPIRTQAPADPAILEAQAHLARLGFPIGATGPGGEGVDGIAGEKTEGALRAFQIMAGLPATGRYEAITRRALADAAAAGRTVRSLAAEADGRGVRLAISVEGTRADFVNAVFFHTILSEEATSVPAQIATAQAILESAYGRLVPVDHEDGRPSYNLFGIKGEGPAGFVSAWTVEEIRGRQVRVLAKFRAYRDFVESIADHGLLLQKTPRYQHLFKTKDPAAWAEGLQAAGYATDSRYAAKLKRIMLDWGLR